MFSMAFDTSTSPHRTDNIPAGLRTPIQITSRPQVRVTNLRIEENKQVQAGWSGRALLPAQKYWSIACLLHNSWSAFSSPTLPILFKTALHSIESPSQYSTQKAGFPRTGRGKLSVLLPKYLAQGKYYIKCDHPSTRSTHGPNTPPIGKTKGRSEALGDTPKSTIQAKTVCPKVHPFYRTI